MVLEFLCPCGWDPNPPDPGGTSTTPHPSPGTITTKTDGRLCYKTLTSHPPAPTGLPVHPQHPPSSSPTLCLQHGPHCCLGAAEDFTGKALCGKKYQDGSPGLFLPRGTFHWKLPPGTPCFLGSGHLKPLAEYREVLPIRCSFPQVPERSF